MDGWMPSDLAGMEGHQVLALLLAQQEQALVTHAFVLDGKRSETSITPPAWFEQPHLQAVVGRCSSITTCMSTVILWKVGKQNEITRVRQICSHFYLGAAKQRPIPCDLASLACYRQCIRSLTNQSVQ
jgi:hypothetical protein